RGGKLAADPAAASDAASWFELLYQAAARGEATIPWASLAPNPHLVQWARARSLRGTGRTALVVGCGFGDDAEFVPSLGFHLRPRPPPDVPAPAPPPRAPRPPPPWAPADPPPPLGRAPSTSPSRSTPSSHCTAPPVRPLSPCCHASSPPAAPSLSSPTRPRNP